MTEKKTAQPAEVAEAAPAKNPNEATVEFDTPIVRGTQEITEIVLRKPKSGELRGVALVDLLQMDVLALRKVLPRITTPSLTDHEIGNMDPADLVDCAGKVAAFLLKKSAREAVLDA